MDSMDIFIEIFREIFNGFSNRIYFKGVVDCLVMNIPREFTRGTRKFIL